MSIDNTQMVEECGRFIKQMLARYGLPLIKSSYGNTEEHIATMVAGLRKAGIEVQEFAAVRSWLLIGLKPFVEYPPSLEAVIQLSKLVGSYPVTTYCESIKNAWYRLDTDYSQRYGRLWLGDTGIDSLTRERVWMTEFEKMMATTAEIDEARARVTASSFFRNYPPTLEQFCDVFLAVRNGGAPTVEEAWAYAQTGMSAEYLHPLVRKAKGLSGGNDPKVVYSGKNFEAHFKKLYREMLASGETGKEKEVLKTKSYLDRSELLRML